jgi:hypothetical protein
MSHLPRHVFMYVVDNQNAEPLEYQRPRNQFRIMEMSNSGPVAKQSSHYAPATYAHSQQPSQRRPSVNYSVKACRVDFVALAVLYIEPNFFAHQPRSRVDFPETYPRIDTRVHGSKMSNQLHLPFNNCFT